MYFTSKKPFIIMTSLAFLSSTTCFAQAVSAKRADIPNQQIESLQQQLVRVKRQIMLQTARFQAGVATFPGCWKGHTAPNCDPFIAKVTFPKAFTHAPVVLVTSYKPKRQQNGHGRTWVLTVIDITNRSFTFRAMSYGSYKPLQGWDFPLSVQYIAYANQ